VVSKKAHDDEMIASAADECALANLESGVAWRCFVATGNSV
jgi:hypothetical protein